MAVCTTNSTLPTYVVRIGIDEFSSIEVIDKLKLLKCCKDTDKSCAQKIQTCKTTTGACVEPVKTCIAPYDKLKKVFGTTLKLNPRTSTFTTYYKAKPSSFPESRPTEQFMCYNYVIGKSKNLPNIMMMRVGEFDYETSLFDLVSCYVRNPKSTATQESMCGIKHIQMASTDMEILFSGVLIIEKKNVVITPMSGTFIENVLENIKKNTPLYTGCIECALDPKSPENIGELMNKTLTGCTIRSTKKDTATKKTTTTLTTYTCSDKDKDPLIAEIELYNFLNIICTEYAMKHLSTAENVFQPYDVYGKDSGIHCTLKSTYTKAPEWVRESPNNPCLIPYIREEREEQAVDNRCKQDIPKILDLSNQEQEVKAAVKRGDLAKTIFENLVKQAPKRQRTK